MARFPKPPEGSWTQHYPELGTEPVSYEDSISPEIYELEREAIFKRAWLNVGRVEQLPRKGSYFTKELKVVNTSIILVRTASGEIKAYHNICRHRGNKLVWNDMPLEETSGVCRQFTCKYHAWRYDLDGNLTFVQQEEEFFDLDKSRYGLVSVHCDVWEGFIFVNFAKTPEQSLREFLGPMVTRSGGLPVRQADLAVVLPLGGEGELEALHGRVPGVLSRAGAAREPVADRVFEGGRARPVSRLRTTAWTARTGWSARRVCGPGRCRTRCASRSTTSARADCSGLGTKPDLGEMPVGLNPAKCDPWGLDSFQLFPNFVMLFWGQGWYLTYHYWPTSYNSHIFEGTLYFPQPRTPRERVAQELAAVTFKEYGLQDANTLEATQSMIESRVIDRFLLNDQEILLRHLHKETAAWIDEYQPHAHGGGVNAMSPCCQPNSPTSNPSPSGACPPNRSATPSGWPAR